VTFDFERQYEVHLLLGDPSAPELWHADSWREIFPVLQPLAERARGAPITTSNQYEGAKNRPVRFGRIGWDDKGHAKWTHRADTLRRFLSAEVWAPSRAACAKGGVPPDFLFTLWNQAFFSQNPTFRDTVLIAVPASDAVSVQACNTVSEHLAKTMRAKFHGCMKRPWGRRFGPSMFTDALGRYAHDRTVSNRPDRSPDAGK
jgi:hypothetical protein